MSTSTSTSTFEKNLLEYEYEYEYLQNIRTRVPNFQFLKNGTRTRVLKFSRFRALSTASLANFTLSIRIYKFKWLASLANIISNPLAWWTSLTIISSINYCRSWTWCTVSGGSTAGCTITITVHTSSICRLELTCGTGALKDSFPVILVIQFHLHVIVV